MARAESFALEEVMSGEEEDCLWVTLGFASEQEANDVLHVVVATSVDDQDRLAAHDTVYLARYDQSLSCYGGSGRIHVCRDTIEVRLDAMGQESLGFSGPVTFTACNAVNGFEGALGMLSRMSNLPCGRIISVEGAEGRG